MIKQQSIMLICMDTQTFSQMLPHIIRPKNGNSNTLYIPQMCDKAGNIFRSTASEYVKSKNINAQQCPQQYTHMKNEIYQCQER